MTPLLKDKIARVKAVLTADPQGVVAGDVHTPASVIPISISNHWRPYSEFLLEADGGRFGSIDVWSHAEISVKQYPSVDYPGGQDRWLVIGQLLYDPLVLEADTGQLYLFKRDCEANGELLGEFDEFFTYAVFGERYVEVIADGNQDEWWAVLRSAGIL
jgi:hypothetical protein